MPGSPSPIRYSFHYNVPRCLFTQFCAMPGRSPVTFWFCRPRYLPHYPANFTDPFGTTVDFRLQDSPVLPGTRTFPPAVQFPGLGCLPLPCHGPAADAFPLLGYHLCPPQVPFAWTARVGIDLLDSPFVVITHLPHRTGLDYGYSSLTPLLDGTFALWVNVLDCYATWQLPTFVYRFPDCLTLILFHPPFTHLHTRTQQTTQHSPHPTRHATYRYIPARLPRGLPAALFITTPQPVATLRLRCRTRRTLRSTPILPDLVVHVPVGCTDALHAVLFDRCFPHFGAFGIQGGTTCAFTRLVELNHRHVGGPTPGFTTTFPTVLLRFRPTIPTTCLTVGLLCPFPPDCPAAPQLITFEHCGGDNYRCGSTFRTVYFIPIPVVKTTLRLSPVLLHFTGEPRYHPILPATTMRVPAPRVCAPVPYWRVGTPTYLPVHYCGLVCLVPAVIPVITDYRHRLVRILDTGSAAPLPTTGNAVPLPPTSGHPLPVLLTRRRRRSLPPCNLPPRYRTFPTFADPPTHAHHTRTLHMPPHPDTRFTTACIARFGSANLLLVVVLTNLRGYYPVSDYPRLPTFALWTFARQLPSWFFPDDYHLRTPWVCGGPPTPIPSGLRSHIPRHR